MEALKLLPSCPAGRSIGYRQTLQYLLRTPWQPFDAAALREFIETFTAASRRYAAQQIKWFRSEPLFEWVVADWEQPHLTVEEVAARIACSREEFEEGLHAPCQAALRALRPEEAKMMRTYVPLVESLSERKAAEALLERADRCRQQLQPNMAEILEADSRIAARFPWHAPAGGASEPAANAAAEGGRVGGLVGKETEAGLAAAGDPVPSEADPGIE